MLKNYMEILVDQVIHELLRDEEKQVFTCSCDICIENIKAIVLNSVKPFYVTSKTGEVVGTYRSMEIQNKTDILAEILRAKCIVEKIPKHNK